MHVFSGSAEHEPGEYKGEGEVDDDSKNDDTFGSSPAASGIDSVYACVRSTVVACAVCYVCMCVYECVWRAREKDGEKGFGGLTGLCVSSDRKTESHLDLDFSTLTLEMFDRTAFMSQNEFVTPDQYEGDMTLDESQYNSILRTLDDDEGEKETQAKSPPKEKETIKEAQTPMSLEQLEASFRQREEPRTPDVEVQSPVRQRV